MAVYWPRGLGIFLSLFVRGLRAIGTSKPVVGLIDSWLKAEDKKKNAVSVEEKPLEQQIKKTTEERRNYLLRFLIDEPFAQGVDAAVLEAELLSSQDWGF